MGNILIRLRRRKSSLARRKECSVQNQKANNSNDSESSIASQISNTNADSLLQIQKESQKESSAKPTESPLSNPNEDSLSTLNVDCLFHIFSYLELPDLLKLRTQCSTLNTLVCEYLPRLTTLSVVLTETTTEKRNGELVPKWVLDFYKTFRRQKNLKLEEFVIIRRKKKFIRFINKYEIRNVQKLTLIINNNSFYHDLPEMLKLFPKVQKLFLDRTCDCFYTTNNPFKNEDLDSLFFSIVNLPSLGELYFFPVIGFDFKYDFTHRYKESVEEKFESFESAMEEKLRTFEKASKIYPNRGHGCRRGEYERKREERRLK